MENYCKQKESMKKLLFLLCLGAGVELFGGPNQSKPQKDDDELLEGGVWDQAAHQKRIDKAKSKEERLKLLEMEALAGQRGVEYWQTKRAIHIIKSLVKPQTVGMVALGALGVFAAWHGTSMVRDVAQNYLMMPALVEDRDTSIRSWSSMVKNLFVYEEKPVIKRDEVIFNDRLKAHTDILTRSIISAAENDAYFRHYLFYGPPGTGKTMLAKAMALEAGLEYMYFPAPNLEEYSLEEGIKQIRHLFEYARAYPKKLMIIIDEADAVFAKRNSCSHTMRAFLNLILAYMGTEQNNFIVIAITNRPVDFDSAALSRFGEKLKIGSPEFNERKEIFTQYAHKYFIQSNELRKDNRSFFQRFLSPRPKTRLPLSVADDVFTEETFNTLAEQSEGLAGRDISDVMLAVQNAAYGMLDRTITQDIIYAALDLKKQQNKQLYEDFEVMTTQEA